MVNLDRITQIHYSSRIEGQSKQDKTIQLSKELTLSFKC